MAEILFDGTRSKGCGVVQFSQVAEAETAIGSLLTSFLRNPGFDILSVYSQVPTIHVRRKALRYVMIDYDISILPNDHM